MRDEACVPQECVTAPGVGASPRLLEPPPHMDTTDLNKRDLERGLNRHQLRSAVSVLANLALELALAHPASEPSLAACEKGER